MKKFLRPALFALAILGTASAASAAPTYYPTDGYNHQTLDETLAFWAQFSD